MRAVFTRHTATVPTLENPSLHQNLDTATAHRSTDNRHPIVSPCAQLLIITTSSIISGIADDSWPRYVGMWRKLAQVRGYVALGTCLCWVCSVPVCCTGLVRPGARARCGRPRLDLVLELTVGRLQEHSPSAINNPACYQQTQEPPVTVLAPEVA